MLPATITHGAFGNLGLIKADYLQMFRREVNKYEKTKTQISKCAPWWDVYMVSESSGVELHLQSLEPQKFRGMLLLSDSYANRNSAARLRAWQQKRQRFNCFKYCSPVLSHVW